MVIELMGNKAGWLTLYAGIAGGADIVLLPEIPYRLETVIASIERRIEHHRSFTIIAIAEGAYDKSWADKKRKERAQLLKEGNFPSVSYYLADQIVADVAGKDAPVTAEVAYSVPADTQKVSLYLTNNSNPEGENYLITAGDLQQS